MPDTAFAAWQERTGLIDRGVAAKVFGVTVQAIGLWVSGKRGPNGSASQLMRLIERRPAGPQRESLVDELLDRVS